MILIILVQRVSFCQLSTLPPRRDPSGVVNKCGAVTQSQTPAGGDRPKPVQAAPTAALLITHSLCAESERTGLFLQTSLFRVLQYISLDFSIKTKG